jgi:hypothetical protein
MILHSTSMQGWEKNPSNPPMWKFSWRVDGSAFFAYYPFIFPEMQRLRTHALIKLMDQPVVAEWNSLWWWPWSTACFTAPPPSFWICLLLLILQLWLDLGDDLLFPCFFLIDYLLFWMDEEQRMFLVILGLIDVCGEKCGA